MMLISLGLFNFMFYHLPVIQKQMWFKCKYKDQTCLNVNRFVTLYHLKDVAISYHFWVYTQNKIAFIQDKFTVMFYVKQVDHVSEPR